MQNFQFFYFTYNHDKSFLILRVIKGNMYTWPPMGAAPLPSEGVGEKSPGYLCFKDYNDGVPIFGSSPVEVYTDNNFFLGWSILSNLSDVSVPKPGFHWEDCKERTKKKLLKNNDDSMHPYKVIVV